MLLPPLVKILQIHEIHLRIHHWTGRKQSLSSWVASKGTSKGHRVVWMWRNRMVINRKKRQFEKPGVMFSTFRKAGKDTPKSDKADKAQLASWSFELFDCESRSGQLQLQEMHISSHLHTSEFRFSHKRGTVAIGGHGLCLIDTDEYQGFDDDPLISWKLQPGPCVSHQTN